MIRQDCEELNKLSRFPFKEYGCKLFSCFYFSEQLQNKYYDIGKIIEITEQLMIADYIDKELSLYENMDGMNKTRMVLKYLGIPAVNVVYRPADYICKSGEYEILKLEKPGYGHFLPGNGKGCYSWDPLGIRPQAKNYTLKSKRIIIL